MKLVESWEKPTSTALSPWPVSLACDTKAFRAACYPPPTEGVSCMQCVSKNSAKMGAWRCDGAEVWATLCRTGGVKPPPAPPTPTGDRNMTVYTAAASVELVVNGQSLGRREMPTQTRSVNATVVQTWAEWDLVKWEPGNATAIARNNGPGPPGPVKRPLRAP